MGRSRATAAVAKSVASDSLRVVGLRGVLRPHAPDWVHGQHEGGFTVYLLTSLSRQAVALNPDYGFWVACGFSMLQHTVSNYTLQRGLQINTIANQNKGYADCRL